MSISTPAITNFTAGEMSPRLEGRCDLSKYFNGCRTLQNFHVHPHGGITRRSGFRFVAEAMSRDKNTLLIPFEFNGRQTYVLEFGEDDTGQGHMRVFADHGVVLSGGDEYVRDIPYTAEEFDSLRYTQSADIMILTHPGHPVRKLTRLSHDEWGLEEMQFIGQPEAWGEGNYPSAVGFFEQRLVLGGTPNEPGTIWFSRSGKMEDFRLNTREVPLESWGDREIRDSNGDGLRDGKAGDAFVLYSGDGFESSDGLKGQHPDGTTRYYRYKGNGNYVAESGDVTITFSNSPAGSDIEPVWNEDGTLNEACWSCFEVGDRTEAEAGDEPLDDDGIEASLSGRQANAIEFMVPRSRLWVGTAGGEWTVYGAGGEPIAPSNVKASHEGSCGASSIRPESVGFATLYIQRAGRKVREMAYHFDKDAYVSNDLTMLSEHISQSGLTQLAFVQEPDSVLYCVRADGVLSAMTYNPAQDVTAWTRLVTRGAVEGVTSIYSDMAKADELWAVVRRTVNGEERRFIEYLEGEFDGEMENAFFVDSGLTYDGDPTLVVAGLDHLIGESVTVLADGAVHADRVVDGNGCIALDRPASRVHAGLAYTSVVQPMRIEGGSHRGTSQTKRQRITRVAVRFHNTLGGRLGPDESSLEPIYFRSPADRMGCSVGAFSGDKSVVFPKGWNRDGVLTVVQDQPLPMTVLLIVPTTVVNE